MQQPPDGNPVVSHCRPFWPTTRERAPIWCRAQPYTHRHTHSHTAMISRAEPVAIVCARRKTRKTSFQYPASMHAYGLWRYISNSKPHHMRNRRPGQTKHVCVCVVCTTCISLCRRIIALSPVLCFFSASCLMLYIPQFDCAKKTVFFGLCQTGASVCGACLCLCKNKIYFYTIFH